MVILIKMTYIVWVWLGLGLSKARYDFGIKWIELAWVGFNFKHKYIHLFHKAIKEYFTCIDIK